MKCRSQNMVAAINILMVFVSSVTIKPVIHTNIAMNQNNWPNGFSRNKEITPFKSVEINSIICKYNLKFSGV